MLNADNHKNNITNKNNMIFKRYNDFLVENALFKGDYDRYDNYFDDIENNKKTLKNFDIEINLLISRFKNLDYTKIKFSKSRYKDDENFEIKFPIEIKTLITPFDGLLQEIENRNDVLYHKIINSYFNGNEPIFLFDVQIERNYFNKFHFPVDLPVIFRNLGLGKKIIKAAIYNFEYLLFTKEDDSFELKTTVHSITEMKDVYSFMKEQNILIFKDDFDLIKKILPKFFSDDYDNKYTLDEDFFIKYKDEITNDEFLSELYKNKL